MARRKELEVEMARLDKQLSDSTNNGIFKENTDMVTGEPIFDSKSAVTPEQNKRPQKATSVASPNIVKQAPCSKELH